VVNRLYFTESDEANVLIASDPMALLIATTKALKRDGEIAFEDTELLARMIDAMICRVALMLPEAGDPKKLRKNALRLIDGLLSAVRKKKNDANA